MSPPPIPRPQHEPDTPGAFGNDSTWWALPTNDSARVVESLGLVDVRRANWQTGTSRAYRDMVFVSPPILGWTIVLGSSLWPGDHAASGDQIRARLHEPLARLSSIFDQALIFSTYDCIDFHLWAKAEQGQLIRAFCMYAEHDDEIIWNEGDLTPEERALSDCLFYIEHGPEAYFEKLSEDLDLMVPCASEVLDIARRWSICPKDFEDLEISPALGLLGTRCSGVYQCENVKRPSRGPIRDIG